MKAMMILSRNFFVSNGKKENGVEKRRKSGDVGEMPLGYLIFSWVQG
jgi:hypothetical protein